MMERYNVRRAQIGDLKVVSKLYSELFKKEQRDFHSNLDLDFLTRGNEKNLLEGKIRAKNTFFLVAVYRKKVVAYLLGGIKKRLPQRRGRYAEVESFFVKEDLRNRGIGTVLIEEFKKWSRRKKINHIFVEASAGNHQAGALYRRLNFQDYSTVLKMTLDY